MTSLQSNAYVQNPDLRAFLRLVGEKAGERLYRHKKDETVSRALFVLFLLSFSFGARFSSAAIAAAATLLGLSKANSRSDQDMFRSPKPVCTEI